MKEKRTIKGWNHLKEKIEYNGLPVPNMHTVEQDIRCDVDADGPVSASDNAGPSEVVLKDDGDR